MAVIENIPIVLDPEKAALSLNRGRANERLTQGLAQAIETAAELWRPKIIHEIIEVLGVDGETVRLNPAGADRPVGIKVGPKADLMAEARWAMVAVHTVGWEILKEIDRLQAKGDSLTAYYLDSIAVLGLGEVGQAVRRLAEAEAKERGWGVSPSLAPGSLVGWPTPGQRELLALLPLAEHNIGLNAHGVIRPFKSASSFIGLGPGYTRRTVGSVCKYCSLNQTCWRRKD